MVRVLASKAKSILVGFYLYLATAVGCIPSHTIRKVLYRSFFRIKIGRGTSIHWQARVFQPSGIRIGAHTVIGNNNFLDGRMSLTIGNCVVTSAEVMILTLHHDIDSPD